MHDGDRVVDALTSAGINGQIIDRTHPEYNDARRIWNGAFDKHPLVVVRVANATDVQKTVRAAKDTGVALAVRGGGHSLAGFSTCDDGIVLDLSSLNTVEVDLTNRTVRIGGGALLHDLDSTCASHGLVVPAGVVSHTGVAGLTLGGGMGWNSRRYGLTIDGLLSVELVTAAGEFVLVDAQSDPDLFWALRGGGGNFGVVTSFTFQARSLGAPVVATTRYPRAQAVDALTALADLSQTLSRQQTTGFTIRPDELKVISLWFGDAGTADAALAPTETLTEPRVGTERSTFLELQHSVDEAVAWGISCYSKGGFLPEFSHDFVSMLIHQMDVAPTTDCDVYAIQLGGAITDVDDIAMAYSGREAAYYYVVSGVWDNPADRESAIAWGRETAKRFGELSMTSNYVNEQSEGGVDFVRRAYGESKYERLVAVKRRLDPDNLFRLNQNITP